MTKPYTFIKECYHCEKKTVHEYEETGRVFEQPYGHNDDVEFKETCTECWYQEVNI